MVNPTGKEEREPGQKWLDMSNEEKVTFIDGCKAILESAGHLLDGLASDHPYLSEAVNELKDHLPSNLLATNSPHKKLIDWITVWYEMHQDERAVPVPDVILHLFKWGPVQGIRMGVRDKKGS